MSNHQIPTSGSNPQYPNPPNEDAILSGSYEQLHRPSASFDSRDDYLNHELQIMQPKRWRPNLHFVIIALNLKTRFQRWLPLLVRSLWWVQLLPLLQVLLV